MYVYVERNAAAEELLGLIDFPKPKGGGVVDVRQPLNFFAETEKI